LAQEDGEKFGTPVGKSILLSVLNNFGVVVLEVEDWVQEKSSLFMSTRWMTRVVHPVAKTLVLKSTVCR
jgi:hypothetical protein